MHCYGERMSLPNWRIAYVFGIPIHVHASWFVVFFFLTWSLATGFLPETKAENRPHRQSGDGNEDPHEKSAHVILPLCSVPE